MENNDDQTFVRNLHNTVVHPSYDDRENKVRYLLTLNEKQAWLIFNEVAKAEASESLCLPMIFSMKVHKSKDKPMSELSEFMYSDHASSETQTDFYNASVIDFKYILPKNRGNELIVPYNVHRIGATVLLSQEPRVDVLFEEDAFKLAFRVDDKVVLRFKPIAV